MYLSHCPFHHYFSIPLPDLLLSHTPSPVVRVKTNRLEVSTVTNSLAVLSIIIRLIKCHCYLFYLHRVTNEGLL